MLNRLTKQEAEGVLNTVADPGEGPGPPLLFDQNEAQRA